MSKQDLQAILQQYKEKKIMKETALQEIEKLNARQKKMPTETAQRLAPLVVEKFFTSNEPLLADHQFFNQPVLVGAAYISLILKALRGVAAAKEIEIQKMLFLQALILAPETKAKVRVELKPQENGGYYFQSTYQLDGSLETTKTAEGQVLLHDLQADEKTEPFESLLEQFKEKGVVFSSEVFYQAPSQTVYGSNLFSLKKVYSLENTALGEIELTPVIQSELDAYVIHPAIFDAMHVLSAFAFSAQAPVDYHWPPLLIKKMCIFPTALKKCAIAKAYAWASHIQHSSELIESNIKLYGPEGDLLIVIEGFCTKRVPQQITADKPLEKLSSENALTNHSIKKEQPASNIASPVNGKSDKKDIRDKVFQYVESKFKAVTGEQLDMTKSFMALGLDSTTMITLTREIEQELSIELYPTLFFERENLAQLIDYFVEEHASVFEKMPGSENNAPVANNSAIQERAAEEKMPLVPAQTPVFTAVSDAMPTPMPVRQDEKCFPIAVIGMAGRFAGANNLEAFWQNILASKDMISEIPRDHWDYRPWYSEDQEASNKTYAKWGSFLADVDKFDPLFFEISGREATWLDPQVRLLLEIFQQTVDDAALGNQIFGSNTGVYVGSCFHEYWDEIVRAQLPIVDYQHASSAMSALSARLSYSYDLRGASIPLDNACASSLTAIHLACQALQTGELDMAFAAGVNLLLSPLHYVYFSRMRALSPTGHCYSFDERGDGYVPGEGVVGVLLKPLDKALADGDPIHAVIRGSAINHVGRSNNPAAPRPEQQIALLKQVWKNADIHPESLSYLEAHGTGTKLGDPIEVNSLIQAFKGYTTKTQFCALGSAKSHIGHLEAAAGLAGLVKVILSMQHGQIPKMPMFQTQNPYFKLENSPLFINKEVIRWPKQAGQPRRAGVSSFGMTGNNAHVVIEEAPERKLFSSASKPCYLITLSAKHPGSLAQKIEELNAWLLKHPETPVEAIAYTLNKGRHHFNFRCALIATTTADLQNKLVQAQSGQKPQGYFQSTGNKEVEDKAIYEQVLNNSLQKFENNQFQNEDDYHKQLEALANLYAKGYNLDWNLLHRGEAQQRISLPGYPFLKEPYWFPTQAVPEIETAMPFDNRINSTALHPLVHRNFSGLESVLFKSYFSGKEFYLSDHQVKYHKVLPGAAYLEMVRAAIEQAVPSGSRITIENVMWLIPMVVDEHGKDIAIALMPFSSSEKIHYEIYSDEGETRVIYSQGDVVLNQTVLASPAWHSPTLLASNLPQTVAKETLYAQFNQAGLQYGPAFQALTWIKANNEIVLAHYELPPSLATSADLYQLHPSLMDGALQSLIGFFTANTDQVLEIPFALEKILIHQKVPAKGYVLARKNATYNVQTSRYDLQIIDETGTVCVELFGFSTRPFVETAAKTASSSSTALRYLASTWHDEFLTNTHAIVAPEGIVVLSTDASIINNLRTQWPAIPIIQITCGKLYQKIDKQTYELPVTDENKIQVWWQEIQTEQQRISHFIIINEEVDLSAFIEKQFRLQALILQARMKLKITNAINWINIYYSHPEQISFGKMLAGFARTLHREHPHYRGKIIKLAQNNPAKTLSNILLDELSSPIEKPTHIHYEAQRRLVEKFEDVSFKQTTDEICHFVKQGVYLITGGLGGLGLIIAHHLAKTYQAKIILTGRSVLSIENQQHIAALNALGAEVLYLEGNVLNKADVKKWFNVADSRFGQLNGIIHAAGIIKDSLFLNKPWADFAEVMAPKLWGTLHLDEASKDKDLDCFILFSSLTSLMGNSGQSDYASANGFMDDFSAWRNNLVTAGQRKGKTIAINWPLWKTGGMQVSADIEKYLAAQGMSLLTEAQGLQALEQALHFSASQIGIYAVTSHSVKQEKPLDSIAHEKLNNLSNKSDTQNEVNYREKLINELQAAIAEVLKLPISVLDTEEDLSNYGFDSITFTELANRLKQHFSIAVAPTLFFEYPTISQFADYLITEHAEALKQLYQLEPVPVTEKEAPLISQPALAQAKTEFVRFIKNKEVQPAATQKEHSNRLTEIAIVGMAGIFPGAADLNQFWENLMATQSAIAEIPTERWDFQKVYGSIDEENKTNSKWGGFITDVDKFDAGFFGISPREAELMDPQQRLFLQCVCQSLENANYPLTRLHHMKAGLFVGVASQDYAELLQQCVPIEAYTATGIAHSILANRVSYLLDLQGPSEAIDTACSSSLVAVHRAVQAIQSGDCDMAIAGGVNVMLTPTLHIAFGKAGMLSPDGRCKTFDKHANGYVRGEGVGVVVLKPLAQALADGDLIHGVIKGTAVNHGGRVNTLTAPNPNAQAELLKTAYRRANIPISSVGLIEAHGTGTALGDPIEINGLKKAFKALQQENMEKGIPSASLHCGISAVKTNIGHLETAAGIAGLIKVLLAFRHKVLPGIANFQEMNPYIDLKDTGFYLLTENRSWECANDHTGNALPRRAGVSSFGFGGVNAHVVLEEAPAKAPFDLKQFQRKPCYLFTFSAKYAQTLQELLINFKAWAEKAEDQGVDLSSISYTLNTGRNHFNLRCAIIAGSFTDLLENIDKAITKQSATHSFLGTLTDVQPDDAAIYEEVLERVIEKLSTLQDVQDPQYAKQLRILANLYVKGYTMEWELLHQNEPKQKIELPIYPFLKQRHWLPLINTNAAYFSALSTAQALPIIATPKTSTGIYSFDEILALLKNKLASLTKLAVEQIDVHEELQNYGFDSIVVAGLAKELEIVIGKKDTSLFFAARSLHDLATRIHEQDQLAAPAQLPSALTPSRHANEYVAIIGAAGRYPQADELASLFEKLKQGADLIEEIPASRWDYQRYYSQDSKAPNKTYAKWGSFINNVDSFDYEHFQMSFNEALLVHPEERLLLEEAWHCFESAGYNPLHWLKQKDNNIGVYIGASFHDYQQIIAESNQAQQTYLPYTSQTYSYANRLSYYFNLTGPSVTLDTACSSSLFAIYEAFHAVREGRCTMALVGGVNLSLHPSKYVLLSQFNFMAKDGKCHAFTEGGSGYVPGEGIGLILLKRLSDAMRDQDNILAVIKGAAAGNDGKTHGFTVPDPDAQGKVIELALNQAQVRPQSIGFIECHGTGTQLGDPIEIGALTQVFNKDTVAKQSCPISSIKSNMGHLEAAAGIAQVTKVILQFQSGKLFPNVMHDAELNKNIQFSETPFYVQKDLSIWPVAKETARRAGISSFGAGGTNTHVVLEEYVTDSAQDLELKSPHVLIPLSADTEPQLFAVLEKLYLFLAEHQYRIFNGHYSVINIAGTLQQGRAERRCRLALVCANNIEALLTELKSIREHYQQHHAFKLKTNVFYYKLAAAPSLEQTAEGDLLSMAATWVQGQKVDWQKMMPRYQKVFLPGYSFKHKLIRLKDNAAPVKQSIIDRNPEQAATAKIYKTVESIFKKVLGDLPEAMDVNEDFANFGIDSITGSRIHQELLQHYPELDDFVLFEHPSLEKLVTHIYTHYSKQASTLSTHFNHLEQVGDIINLMSQEKIESFNKEYIISMTEFIRSYEASGGKTKITIKKVVLDNHKSIEIVTAGEGEAIIFLPPFNTSAIIWINQITILAKYFKVIVINYPGIGTSDWIEGVATFSDLSAVIVEVTDKLRSSQFIQSVPVTLVGWSFGGFLAQTIAAEHPNYIKQIILISTTMISWSSKEYTITGEQFSQRSAQQFKENFERLPAFIKNMEKIKILQTEDRIEAFVLGTTDQKIINTYFLMIAKFRHQNVAQQIKIKAYLISGAQDDLMPAKFARELHNQIKESEYYEVAKGEHFMSLFNKNIVNKKLLKWLGLSNLVEQGELV